MSDKVFQLALWALALLFTAIFIIVVGPPLADDGWNVVWAFGQGFVNSYSSGYAYDIFVSYAVLAVWVIHEATAKGVKHGWIALVLGVIPGVAVGLAAYLLIRAKQVSQTA